MTAKQFIPVMAIVTLLFLSCGQQEIPCFDPEIRTAFVNYAIPDIDTFVLRKFKAADNYQTLLDTFNVIKGGSVVYSISHDTTTVSIADGKNGIKTGFDWQIFIPAKNKTVFISDIVSEKNGVLCRSGIFSMDKHGCSCANRVFSARNNNQLINFPNPGGVYTVYIGN